MEEVTMDWREIMVEEGAEALFDAVAFQGLTQECLLSLAKKEDGSLRARTSVLTSIESSTTF